jgi:formylglycine-generating enzyme required for sulfatase activity
VVGVSWDEVTSEYLPWLSRTSGKTYRLLSEAEWTYVASRSGDASFGVKDLGVKDLGDAFEWVEDCYQASYVGAPADGSAWTTKCETAKYGNGLLRVVRGAERNLTPSSVAGIVPPLVAISRNNGASGFRDKFRGFRVARSL